MMSKEKPRIKTAILVWRISLHYTVGLRSTYSWEDLPFKDQNPTAVEIALAIDEPFSKESAKKVCVEIFEVFNARVGWTSKGQTFS